MPLPSHLRDGLPAFGPRSPDDQYVAISNSVPGGFAGLFFENGNHLVLTFVDPSAAELAREEIAGALAGQHMGSGLDVSKAEIRPARWTFAELDEWYRYIVPKVFTRESGISSSDIDEKANAIAFGVVDENARARLEADLASLNVSCNLVTTAIRPYAIAF